MHMHNFHSVSLSLYNFVRTRNNFFTLASASNLGMQSTARPNEITSYISLA